MIVAGLGAAACVYLYFEYQRITRREAAEATRLGSAATLGHPLSRSLIAHVAWSGIVLSLAALPHRPRALGSVPAGRTARLRRLREVGRSPSRSWPWRNPLRRGAGAVRWWTASLRARGVADARAARDWYLLAAVLGLLVAPLLAFTLVSALR